MDKFLRKILILVSIILCANLYCYFVIFQPILYKSYTISVKELRKYNTVLLSDSHGQAVSKSDLAKIGILNFANGGDNYVDMLIKLNYIINKGINIDTLLLSIDEHLISEYRENKNNSSRSIYYADIDMYKKYYNRNSFIDFIYSKYIAYYLPLTSSDNYMIIKEFFVKKMEFFNKSKSDSKPIFKSDDEYWRKNCLKRINSHFPTPDSSKYLADALIEIIMLCEKNKIKIIALKYPVSHLYHELKGSKTYNIMQYVNNYNIECFNFYYTLIDNDSYFSDQDHVNEQGSKILINLIKSELKRSKPLIP